MSEMIERVARAISMERDGNFEQPMLPVTDYDRELAAAAIKAMREPSIEMVAAFWRQKNCGTQEVGERGDATSDYDAWRAAIDAALVGEVG